MNIKEAMTKPDRNYRHTALIHDRLVQLNHGFLEVNKIKNAQEKTMVRGGLNGVYRELAGEGQQKSALTTIKRVLIFEEHLGQPPVEGKEA